METLVDEGKVKSIGVSNFNESQIQRILDVCKHKPVVNQVEIHPYCPQTELHEFCKKNEIYLEAYAPLGKNEEREIFFLINLENLGAQGREWKEKDDPEVMDDKVIKSIADKYHVHPAMILLRYILDRDIICIAKSSNNQRLRDNFNLFKDKTFQLNQEDFDKIQRNIPTRFRYYTMGDCIGANEYPFKEWKNHIPKQQ
jgi:diketogulonate reductase-like aldo/keto reductase